MNEFLNSLNKNILRFIASKVDDGVSKMLCQYLCVGCVVKCRAIIKGCLTKDVEVNGNGQIGQKKVKYSGRLFMGIKDKVA